MEYWNCVLLSIPLFQSSLCSVVDIVSVSRYESWLWRVRLPQAFQSGGSGKEEL
jgi:hypothetical protein